MNLQNNLNKLEVSFWDWLIQAMTSSKLAQNFIRHAFSILRGKEIIWMAFIFLAWLATGIIVAGYLKLFG